MGRIAASAAAFWLALCAGPAQAFLLVISSDDAGVPPQTILERPWPVEIAPARRVDTLDADGVVRDWYGRFDGELEGYARLGEGHRERRLAWAAEKRRTRAVIGALRADASFLTEHEGEVYAAVDPAVVLGAVSFWCSALPEAMRGDEAVAAAGLPRLEREALAPLAQDWRGRLGTPALVPDGESAVAPFDRRDGLFALLMFMDRHAPGGRRLAALDGLDGRQRLAVICAALAR